MLVNSKLPTTFWAEAVNTACYVQNTVLVIKPHNKTPYELFLGKKLALGFMRSFGCPVTILNTINHLGKFDGKADEGFFVGYSINTKAFRVFNSKTRIVKENPHVQFSTKACDDAGDNEKKATEEPGGDTSNNNDRVNSTNNINTAINRNNTNNVKTVSSTINTAGIEVNAVSSNTSIELLNDPNMPELEDIMYSNDYEDVGAEANMNNLNIFMPVSPIPTSRIHKYHTIKQIIGELNSSPPTRRMTKNLEEHEAMQDELLQFKLQKVWTLVDLPNGKRPIGTKWVYRNKKDERGIVIKNKARLVAQMDVKSAFLYGKIEEKVYVCQPLGFEDPDFPDRVYKVEKALYGLHQAPPYMLASTPRQTQKLCSKDEDVCAYARYQVNPKVSHLHAVKRIFRYLKCQPKLGLWYPKGFTFLEFGKHTLIGVMLGASLDRKSTIGGCQFLRCRLISWQCKKQTMVVNSITKVEYVAALSCCGQVLWIQNQLLDYGDSNEKKLIQMIKIHTEKNAIDLLTKAFDATVKVKMVNGEQQLQALVDGKKIIITKAIVRRDLQLEDADGVDCLPNATIFKHLTLMGMVKNLDNAVKFLMYPGFVQKRVKKLEKKEGSRTYKLKRLYRVGRSTRVFSSKEESLGDQKDASKQERIDDIDADKDIYLVNVHRDEDMFRLNDLEGDEVVVESEVANKDVNLSIDEVTLAQALAALKSAKVQEKGDVIKEPSVPVSAASTKVSTVIPTTAATTITAVSSRPRAKGIVFHEQEQEQEQAPTPIVSSQQPTQVKDKGKGKMVEEEPVKKMSKKELLKLDEELAFKLQAEEDEEERLAREKA
ncbi:putative ribonuclease H-like domain-containing protein [Tanacetum coccineum]